ncbi:Crp/Fnr family transcriptional regulator [Hymenobacter cellulosilyticus]|uniref:Crp/Fnr family transcriptional regulator n=1 Tax=Hymenobacter cellulosilyticus TaxID=2932248 RepID=A0A8T9Q396_9BACT|nr:Crp/Fnr family transcriptional regulator [Hymenobacter cellulosilyticus]UOQ72014.1 Crp/Fnr family transcriptional regulator [Hymenobacter cellulosilyticus]
MPRTVAKQEYLIEVGHRVTTEFLVVKGCLKTSAYDAEGKEYIVQFALENWWVSDYPALTHKASAGMAVQALEPSIVLELPVEQRDNMCQQVPAMHIFFGNKALRGYVAAQNRVLSLLRNSAKEKYELLLGQYPELFQRLPKKTLAHYLGVSRETLSRLEKRG